MPLGVDTHAHAHIRTSQRKAISRPACNWFNKPQEAIVSINEHKIKETSKLKNC